MASEACQVAVVGAGPYGLATAAHLREAGVDVRTFGSPMEFWERQMPRGMLLRSAWEASHIAHPDARFTLDEYESEAGVRLRRPIPLEDFVRYGHWYQQRLVPDVDGRRVERANPVAAGWELTLADGERLRATRVVVATGLASFDWWPPEFRSLPRDLVSHSSQHDDLSRFAGRRVAVIGAGQSAVESAALLAEGGADVELIARTREIRWLVYERARELPSLVHALVYPPTDVGPPLLNWVVALPELFRLLPARLQARAARRCIRPAAATWLRDRVRSVRVTEACTVLDAVPRGGGLELALSDGTTRLVDHLLLATGYRVDVSRLPFLEVHPIVRDGYPKLSRGFESSLPGLHFVGAAAAESFGPVMRFVVGAMYAAHAVRRCVLEEGPPSVAYTVRAYSRRRDRVHVATI